LAKGICEGLGIAKREVISPTFVLLRNYQGRVPVYHFDLYRMEKADDVLGLGMDEYLYGDGVSIIEWADRLGFLTPVEFLKIELSVRPGTQRQLSFTAVGKRYAKIKEQVREDIGG
jgi:tRNA threonylcarbamoyladenosine biosynthesis protein TsaE